MKVRPAELRLGRSVWTTLTAAKLSQTGTLPLAGGLLDQSANGMAAVMFARGELARLERI